MQCDVPRTLRTPSIYIRPQRGGPPPPPPQTLSAGVPPCNHTPRTRIPDAASPQARRTTQASCRECSWGCTADQRPTQNALRHLLAPQHNTYRPAHKHHHPQHSMMTSRLPQASALVAHAHKQAHTRPSRPTAVLAHPDRAHTHEQHPYTSTDLAIEIMTPEVVTHPSQPPPVPFEKRNHHRTHHHVLPCNYLYRYQPTASQPKGIGSRPAPRTAAPKPDTFHFVPLCNLLCHCQPMTSSPKGIGSRSFPHTAAPKQLYTFLHVHTCNL